MQMLNNKVFFAKAMILTGHLICQVGKWNPLMFSLGFDLKSPFHKKMYFYPWDFQNVYISFKQKLKSKNCYCENFFPTEEEMNFLLCFSGLCVISLYFLMSHHILKFSPISGGVEITVKWYIHIYSGAVIVYVPNVETK